MHWGRTVRLNAEYDALNMKERLKQLFSIPSGYSEKNRIFLKNIFQEK